jgi:REP element-mobilizing transposase RayT
MLYHVVARGNEKQCIFLDDVDCRTFLELLAEALERFGIRCLSYCLLWNHYHLLVKTGALPISRLMQQVNSSYCQRFNRRHGRVGHVLQGRFGSRMVEDGAYAREVLRYIALNPVNAGRVTDPEEWPWSSYRFTVGAEAAPAFIARDEVWAAFGTADQAVGRLRFQEFVELGLAQTLTNPLFHGSDRLAELVAPLLKPLQYEREHVYSERFATRPPLSTLFEGCLSKRDVKKAVHAAFFEHAYTLEEIGRMVARDPSVVCRWVRQANGNGKLRAMSSAEDNPAKNKI